MFGHVTVVRSHKGELLGCSESPSQVAAAVTPLFYLTRRGVGEERSEEVDLGVVADRIAKAWRRRGSCYVNLRDKWELDGGFWSLGEPAELVNRFLRNAGVSSIPVLDLYKSEDASLTRSLGSVAKDFGCGAALRVVDDELGVARETIERMWDAVGRLGLQASQIDLLIDLERIHLTQMPRHRAQILELLSEADRLFPYRSVTIIGSSLPEELSAVVPEYELREFPRLERRLLREVRSGRGGGRPVRGGDYAATKPEFVETNGPFPHISARIIYTGDESTLVLRGCSRQKRALEEQYLALSRSLIAHGRFHGDRFSWGDRLISQFATHGRASGDPTTWVAINTSHHLAVVAKEVGTAAEVERM